MNDEGAFVAPLYFQLKNEPKQERGAEAPLSSVGVTGFEPATPCTPCKCATGLRYTPKELSHSWGSAPGMTPRLTMRAALPP
jgi:hypothetical protein